METKTLTSLVIFGLGAVLFFGFQSTASADVSIPGMGSGADDVPSVAGPGDKIDKAPVCDMRARPKITKVEPDTMKPGDKITIKGENFATKECFQGVSFGGMADGCTISFNSVTETTVEATVPTRKHRLT